MIILGRSRLAATADRQRASSWSTWGVMLATDACSRTGQQHLILGVLVDLNHRRRDVKEI